MIRAARERYGRAILGWILAAAMAGCVRLPSSAATQSSPGTAAVTASASPSAAPMAARFTNQTLTPGEAAGEWTVSGLITNTSSFAAADIRLRIDLIDVGGVELASQIIAPLLDELGPGETSPFTALFRSSPGAASVRAAVESSSISNFARAAVTIRDLKSAPDSFGGTSIYGLLVNPNDKPAAIHQVAVDAQQGNRILATGAREAGLTYLAPRQSAPFLAHLPIEIGSAQLTGWVDSVVATAQVIPAGVMATTAHVSSTSQGTPFVVGTVTNRDGVPHFASLVVTLSTAGEIVGLADVDLPIPIGPGESTVFAATSFPGLPARMADVQASTPDLTADAVVDPAGDDHASGGTVASIDVTIMGYEVIGSSLFLKADVGNPRSVIVRSPAVMAAVRSTEGQPVTAGSGVATSSLAPGEHAAFTLVMPLPSGIDPAMLEYDLQAAGFISP